MLRNISFRLIRCLAVILCLAVVAAAPAAAADPQPAAANDQGGAATAKPSPDKAVDPSANSAAAKPAAKPAEKPADKPAEKPTDKTAEKPADKPVEKPADKAVAKDADKLPAKEIVKPADKTADKPAEKSADKPTAKATGDKAADAAESEAEQPKDWQVLMSIHQESVVQQAARFKSMEELLPKNVRRFRTDLSALEGKIDELGLIISLSGGNPWELRAVLGDFARVRRSVEALMAPSQESRDELEKIAARLDSLKEEFTKRLEDDPEPQIADAINYYLRYLKGVRTSLAGVKSTLDKELAPARDVLAGLDKSEEALRVKIPKAWKTYYFTASNDLFSQKAWNDLDTRVQHWLKSNTSMLRSLTHGGDGARAVAVLTKAGVALAILLVAGIVGVLRLRRSLPQLAQVGTLYRVWLLAGLGLILHWGSRKFSTSWLKFCWLPAWLFSRGIWPRFPGPCPPEPGVLCADCGPCFRWGCCYKLLICPSRRCRRPGWACCCCLSSRSAGPCVAMKDRCGCCAGPRRIFSPCW